MILLRHKVTGEYAYTIKRHVNLARKLGYRIARWDLNPHPQTPEEYCETLNNWRKTCE